MQVCFKLKHGQDRVGLMVYEWGPFCPEIQYDTSEELTEGNFHIPILFYKAVFTSAVSIT
jgi:hypothetical protein